MSSVAPWMPLSRRAITQQACWSDGVLMGSVDWSML